MTFVVGSVSKCVFYFKKTVFPKKAFSNMFICVGQMKATWHTSLSAVVSHTVFDIIPLSYMEGKKSAMLHKLPQCSVFILEQSSLQLFPLFFS